MTEEDAHDVMQQGESLAKSIVVALVKMSKPDVAVVALGLAAGFVFANLEKEDNIDEDEMFNEWLDAVKEQYKESKLQIADATKKHS